ncbi:MAG: ATP-binding cassette domain-containing protein [Alphaproteobacteria bacterium]
MTTTEATARQPLLRISHIAKRFGAVVALADVTFEIYPGEVVALLGDNGAGKSTLIKILAGNQQPDSGTLTFEGREVHIDTPADAKALGIQTVYQDLSLCGNVDVVANFFMGRELCSNVVGMQVLREREMETVTRQAMAEIGATIPSVRSNVEHLSGGQRQAIELARFVHWGGKLVMLDEPFAALGVRQTHRGLELIERVKSQGVAVVVITHNVLHAFAVADRFVVLRQGRVAGVRDAHSSSHEEVVALITGESAAEAARRYGTIA